MKKKYVAILAAFIFLFVFFVSAFFVIIESDHNCIGENCPICQIIAICDNTVRNLGIVLKTVLLFSLTITEIRKVCSFICLFFKNSGLVSEKDKLTI